MPDIITFGRLAEILEVDLNYFSENFPAAPSATVAAETPARPAEKPGRKKGWDMSRGNWVDADFSGLKNLHEKFSESNMQRCLFRSSDLSGLLLRSNQVEGCDFSGSDMSGSRFQSTYIQNSLFRQSSLRDSDFRTCHIRDCDLTETDFTGAEFKVSTFQKNDMSGALWKHTSFEMTGFVDTVMDGKVEDCSFVNCDFRNFAFRNATLINSFFKCKSLKKIRFIDCKADKLTWAFLKNGKADLSGVSLLEEEEGGGHDSK